MKKSLSVFFLLMLCAVAALASEPKELSELKKVFEQFGANGSILIYDQQRNSYAGYNLPRCNTPFSPASTFKIPNTLIALETGIATPETVFKWNGEKRAFPTWEKDMDIREAFRLSAVPVYQEIARRVGVERMQYYIRLFGYGDMDIQAENIGKFWLEGDSQITQYQQIYFLCKLYNLQLPVSERAMKLTKDIMVYETTADYVLSSKTGWAVRQKKNVTWLVGYVETGGNVYYFATNLEADEGTDVKNFGQMRIDLTKAVLTELGII